MACAWVKHHVTFQKRRMLQKHLLKAPDSTSRQPNYHWDLEWCCHAWSSKWGFEPLSLWTIGELRRWMGISFVLKNLMNWTPFHLVHQNTSRAKLLGWSLRSVRELCLLVEVASFARQLTENVFSSSCCVRWTNWTYLSLLELCCPCSLHYTLLQRLSPLHDP